MYNPVKNEFCREFNWIIEFAVDKINHILRQLSQGRQQLELQR